jgi:short-subunit dehydrogenase
MKVFITGASSGLGEGLVRHYGRNGAVVGLCARRAQTLADLARVVESQGARPIVQVADVSDTAAAVQTFMDALRLELRGTGVHAMTLCPGFVQTPLTAKLPGKLPFLLSRDAAVEDIVGAIDARARSYLFPWQVRLLGHVLRWAPESWVLRLSPPARPAEPS